MLRFQGPGFFDGQIIGNDIDFKRISMTGNPFTGNIPASAVPEPSFYTGLMGIGTLIAFVNKRRKSALKKTA